MKEEGRKIVFLTAYDWLLARYVAEAGVDGILVGDSVAHVFAGRTTTIPVTLEEMIYHARAVRRGAPDTFLVVDMPFLSFQISPEESLRNAGRILKETEAEAVKLEGGERSATTVARMVETGIPVMGHVGLTPQSVNQLGGYKVQGRTEEAHHKLVEDAKGLEAAGVFSVVLEAVPEGLAAEVTASLEVPTIGIGAGRFCDAQVLVWHDFLGISEGHLPRFVKRYAELGEEIKRAAKEFATDVAEGRYPGPDHVYR